MYIYLIYFSVNNWLSQANMSLLQQTPGNQQTNLFISSLRGEPRDAISESECQMAQVKEKVKKTHFLR